MATDDGCQNETFVAIWQVQKSDRILKKTLAKIFKTFIYNMLLKFL